MNLILWVTQVLIATSFIWAASMKLFAPDDKLAQMWPWTADNAILVKLTGVIDLTIGIGLVLPVLFHRQARLTIYAAYGTIALMTAASIFHISRGEASQVGVNLFFAILALFIVWGRANKHPKIRINEEQALPRC
ncbi:DoxX family protein [Rhodocytophaga rosea]|nr:DoxX family protein [Rhodocytophaga rosea]